jgi:tetraacyldisaccharide 4'-kinase
VGRLRESLASLRRAGLIVLTHFHPDNPVHEKIWSVCVKTLREDRLAACRTRPTGCRDLRTGKPVPLDQIKGMRLLPFCGIAKPASFLHSLETAGAEFPYLIRLSDHHHYGLKDVEWLSQAYTKSHATHLMTTEKDAVKLEGLFLALPILVLQVEIEWVRGKENLERELFKIFT